MNLSGQEDDSFDCKVCLMHAVDPLMCSQCSCIVCLSCNKRFKKQECPMCRADNSLVSVKNTMDNLLKIQQEKEENKDHVKNC